MPLTEIGEPGEEGLGRSMPVRHPRGAAVWGFRGEVQAGDGNPGVIIV